MPGDSYALAQAQRQESIMMTSTQETNKQTSHAQVQQLLKSEQVSKKQLVLCDSNGAGSLHWWVFALTRENQYQNQHEEQQQLSSSLHEWMATSSSLAAMLIQQRLCMCQS